MNTKYLFFAGASILASTLGGVVAAQETQERYVQIAEIEIDPAQLEAAGRIDSWGLTPGQTPRTPRIAEIAHREFIT